MRNAPASDTIYLSHIPRISGTNASLYDLPTIYINVLDFWWARGEWRAAVRLVYAAAIVP